jgi:hypothetical protein
VRKKRAKKNSPAETQQNCLNYLLIHQINQKAIRCKRRIRTSTRRLGKKQASDFVPLPSPPGQEGMAAGFITLQYRLQKRRSVFVETKVGQ